MTGQLSVIMAGMLWLAASCVLMEVARILGPSFHTKRTVHWFWRGVTWAGAAIFFLRGMTLLFPGQLIEVSRVSAVAPLAALGVLGVVLALLDWVMRDRAPPPWSVTVMRMAALLGRDGPVRMAAMAVPPAAVGDVLPCDEAGRQRRSRLPVLIGAAAVVVAIAVFLAVNAPGAAP